MPVARQGERHGGEYNTLDEIEFLDDMPRLMSIRAGDKEFPRKQSDANILGQYRQYLSASMYRKEWGAMDKKSVLEHCRKLMLRYARRALKNGYQGR